MKSIKSMIVAVVFCIICLQSIVMVDAAGKPETDVPINKVSFEKAKASIDGSKLNFSIKAKNKSKSTARKVEVKYKVVVEYTDVKTVKTNKASKSTGITTSEEQTVGQQETSPGKIQTSEVAHTTTGAAQAGTAAQTTTGATQTGTVAQTTTGATQAGTVAQTTTGATQAGTAAQTTTGAAQTGTVAQTTTGATQTGAAAQTTTSGITQPAGEVQSTSQYETVTKTKTKTIYVTAKYKDLKKGKKATVKKSVKHKIKAENIVVKSVSLVQKKIYSKTGVLIFNAKNGEVKLRWGTEDKTAPKITGMIETDSYEGSDCYITIFSDQKDFNFSKYITAEDDRDGKVKIDVDTDKIDWKKRGDYKVNITATDKAGNKAKSWLKVHVEPEGTLSDMADDILDKIISDSWSEEKKLRAIYSYVQGHISYVDSNTRYTWQEAAMNGVRYGYGSCFTYYSLSKLLICRIGIPNLEITRYPASYGNHHWWNLVYTNGGWYHFDNTPRVRRSYLCLLTDAQLKATGHYSSIDQSKYPARAKKAL